MRLNRLRVLMDLKHGRRDVPRKRGAGFTWAMVKWYERHGLVRRIMRKDTSWELIERFEVTEKGLESMKVAIAEHEAHGSFRPREQP